MKHILQVTGKPDDIMMQKIKSESVSNDFLGL